MSFRHVGQLRWFLNHFSMQKYPKTCPQGKTPNGSGLKSSKSSICLVTASSLQHMGQLMVTLTSGRVSPFNLKYGAQLYT
jgi:hypothetical protein